MRKVPGSIPGSSIFSFFLSSFVFLCLSFPEIPVFIVQMGGPLQLTCLWLAKGSDYAGPECQYICRCADHGRSSLIYSLQ
ncbi:hypothetical protein QBC44DRAFT_313990 [Cladorrhinum sp. PSN332]|nr:hypothetical protein QBC44DRAFT_313990 [Cladorrhinum sp. PSN332]